MTIAKVNEHGEQLAVLKVEIEHVRQEVKRNREENDAHAKATMAAIETLKADMNERKGAEKLANAIRMTFAGTIGAFMVKAISWLGAIPR
jgi:septal ring factor EnvC (AmiA/AmiB activator)